MVARLLALVLIAASVPAVASARDMAGLYDMNQMERAGGLALSPNGHFRYAVDYGAGAEESERRRDTG